MLIAIAAKYYLELNDSPPQPSRHPNTIAAPAQQLYATPQ
ncbi:hypothetical protein L13192_12541 [Pyrenophora tritici-repentis]|nr:hypothetical protein L13192_12541 [Pyrenophora tritici-repentis]